MSTQKHGTLWGTKIYLSGPMENTSDGRSWRQTAKARLSNLGIVCFDPYEKPFLHAFEENEQTRAELKDAMQNGEFDWVHRRMKEVRNTDLRICDLSDFGLFFIDPKIVSYGTAEELSMMNSQKKPCFIVVNGGKKLAPLWLMGVLPPHYFYDSLEDALSMIERIDSGRREIDSNRWRILKEEYRFPLTSQ